MGNNIFIREAIHSDIPVIEELIENGYRNDVAKQGWTHETDLLVGARLQVGEIETCLNDSNQKFFIACEGDKQVGVICVFRDKDWIEFGKIAVDPNCQGKGIGKILIAKVEEFVRDKWQANNLKLCVLTVRTELIDFYRRLGFEATGEIIDFVKIHPYVVLKDGVDDLFIQVMEKQI